MFGTILFCLMLIAFGLQIFYYGYFYSAKIAVSELEMYEKEGQNPKVSVIIAARNEAEGLEELLPKLMKQVYPNFEIIVVDDGSSDTTAAVTTRFSFRYNKVKLLKISEFDKGNKKRALSRGIAEAESDFLLFIDADCVPASEFWISHFMNTYNKGVSEIVLAYGAYFPASGLLNKMIRFDTIFAAMQYFSFAQRGLPYMAVGRNFSYKKELFVKNSGFDNHSNLLSGDDDLFMKEAATKYNTAVLVNRDAVTKTLAKSTLREWLNQKQRHLSTSSEYKLRIKVALAGELFSRFFFYLPIFFVSCLNSKQVVLYSVIFLFRILLQYIVLAKFEKKVGEKSVAHFVLIFDILLPLIFAYLHLKNLFAARQEW